jgi:hypothetical protein
MRLLIAVLLAAGLVGSLSAQDSAATHPKKVKRSTTVITFEEIDPIRTESPTAYELIQRLRPNFLHTRGPNTFGNAAGSVVPTPRVVIDGTPRGELDLLRQTPTIAIREIRYLNGADASIQFGTGYGGGAILIFTR